MHCCYLNSIILALNSLLAFLIFILLGTLTPYKDLVRGVFVPLCIFMQNLSYMIKVREHSLAFQSKFQAMLSYPVSIEELEKHIIDSMFIPGFLKGPEILKVFFLFNLKYLFNVKPEAGIQQNPVDCSAVWLDDRFHKVTNDLCLVRFHHPGLIDCNCRDIDI